MTPRTPAPAAGHRTPTVELEATVLDAADRLVAEAGPSALSIRRLATEAGVAPMSIYNRFGDKAGVLDALFTRGFELLHQHTGDPALLGSDLSGAEASERLHQAGRAYRRFAKTFPGTYSLMFDRASAEFEPSLAGIETAARSFDGLVDLVVQAQRSGAMVGGSSTELAQRIWATIHGAVSLELRQVCFVDDTDAHYEALLQTISIGLAPDRGVPGIADDAPDR